MPASMEAEIPEEAKPPAMKPSQWKAARVNHESVRSRKKRLLWEANAEKGREQLATEAAEMATVGVASREDPEAGHRDVIPRELYPNILPLPRLLRGQKSGSSFCKTGGGRCAWPSTASCSRTPEAQGRVQGARAGGQSGPQAHQLRLRGFPLEDHIGKCFFHAVEAAHPFGDNDTLWCLIPCAIDQVRSPCVGDKFSSMHGQQGVVGFLESRDNFPFTCQGIVPDVVINPHAFPTRQTPGQLLKATLEKGITLGGKIRYATPFTTPSVEVISQQLHKAGFQRWGDESVVNGRTGERMKSVSDFHGPCLLPKADTHVRRQGEIPEYRASAPLTRQPVADRQRFGGVKFGEMERDCLLAHGAAANLHQRLFMLGDFSETCERVANVIVRPVQRDSENKIRIVVPYGAKLFYQELFSWGSASSSRWKSARTPSSGRIVYISSISV